MGDGPSAIAFDGTHMWVVNIHGSVTDNSGTVLELSPSGATLGTYAVGNTPSAIAFDGTHMWVANDDSKNVTEL